ncbi:polyprenyl synthetase [Streptomyces sp. NPDC059740]|uniref:polyprenyl synthetase n=1 Tax=Streptomyces sp. NPDC059740 TaxID=3346926 RepID=UPI00366A4251
MGRSADEVDDPGTRAVWLAAGLVDLAWSVGGSAVRTARSALSRSDLHELADHGRREVQARGRLALDRHGVQDQAHLEILARHVQQREDGTGA